MWLCSYARLFSACARVRVLCALRCDVLFVYVIWRCVRARVIA